MHDPKRHQTLRSQGPELGYSTIDLEKNTLLVADLEEEATLLAEAGVKLELVSA